MCVLAFSTVDKESFMALESWKKKVCATPPFCDTFLMLWILCKLDACGEIMCVITVKLSLGMYIASCIICV